MYNFDQIYLNNIIYLNKIFDQIYLNNLFK